MKISVSIVILTMILSCSNGAPGANKADSTRNKFELTTEQREALDALDVIQVSTDEKNRLYSTFPNIKQPCYPADSNFTISQAEFFIAIKHFTSIHCTNLPIEQQESLSETSASMQAEYQVLYCSEKFENEDYEHGLPRTGTWVLPNVLGRRDVTMIW